MTDSLRRAWVLGLAFALLGVTLGVYWRTGEFGFLNYDDNTYVTSNQAVAGGLTSAGVEWAFAFTGYAANWHPLTWIAHMLDVEMFGLDNPGGHHLSSAVLHALTAALLLITLAVYTRALWPSVFVACLFALHPQRVESVAWISERKDLLAGFFGMATLLAYAFYARKQKNRIGAMALVALFFTLGLLAKPMLVTLPFLMLVLDRWPLGRTESLGRLVREKAPLFALVILSSAATWHAQTLGGAREQMRDIGAVGNVANAFEATAQYLASMVWPHDLALFYPHRAIIEGASYEPWNAGAWIGLGLVLGVTLAGYALRRSMPWLLTGWLWFLGMLVPVIGFVPVGIQSHADRYTYLPTIGVAIAIAWSARALARKSAWSQRAIAVLGTTWLLWLTSLTMDQTETWRSTETVMTHAIEVTDSNFVAHMNLAAVYENERRFKDALEHYAMAVALRPGQPLTHYQFARLLQRFGRAKEATEQFQQSVDASLRREHPGPELPVAQAGLGLALSMDGRDAEAIPYLRAAWITTNLPAGDRFAAGQALAWLLATSPHDDLRDGTESKSIASACLAQGASAARLEVLAAAHAELGAFEDAIRVEEQALAAIPPAGQKDAQRRLAGYREGRPHRKP